MYLCEFLIYLFLFSARKFMFMRKSLLFILSFFTTLALYSQLPVANFTQNATTGCGNLVVQFQDQSTGNPTSWLWEFGEGSGIPNSTLQNPAVSYSSPGTYNVRLTVTNSIGSNSTIKMSLIKVHVLPVVDFTSSDTSGCQPFTVSFNPNISGGGNIIQYTWGFGDGNSSSNASPTYTYNTSGNFAVTLNVRDHNNCVVSKSKFNYISVMPKPNVSFFGFPTDACDPPLTTQFTNMTQGNNLSFLWNFGDGNSSNAENPSNIYTTSGSYDVSLQVENEYGCKDTLKLNSYIDVGNFEASFVASVQNDCAPLTTTFTGTANANAQYVWDFGDGTQGSGNQISHTYYEPGQYSVKVVATNDAGCIDSVTYNNYIEVWDGPIIDISADKTEGCQMPFTVNFTNNTPNTGSCVWNFGDGSAEVSGSNVSHSFGDYGYYDVSVTITDQNGCTSDTTFEDYIYVRKPIPYMVADVNGGCAPLTVNFSDTSSTTSPITTWHWDFGDGSTSNSPTPAHTYADTGTYNVTLTITNEEGCTETYTVDDFIGAGMTPEVSFFGDSLFGCHPLETQFTNTSSDYATDWQWQFGDGGGFSYEEHPFHQFQDTGFVDVTLIVYHHGCSDTLVMEDYVYVRYPKPNFATQHNISCSAPHTVSFSDMSQGATQWYWDFGNGETSSEQNPSTTYLTPGSYSVKLVVFNDTTSCSDSLTRTAYIKISDIQGGFEIIPNEICQYSEVCFQDTSTSLYPIIDWKWYYGDGATDFDSTTTTCHSYYLPGQYNVRLNITDENYCNKNIIYNNAVTVRTLPSPRIGSDATIGCAPFTVNFTDESFNQEPTNIVSWLWDFGDGNTSTQQNPTHTYEETGTYNVMLSITDARGCDSSKTFFNYITISKPQARFFSDTLICKNDDLAFFNLSTGDFLTYLWDFGNGTTSTQANTVCSYNSVDETSYIVSLVATDVNGCKDSTFKTVHVLTPTADFYAASQTSDCPPFNASFFNDSSADVVSWKWDFGDSSTGSSNTSFFPNPQHYYENSGEFDVRLIVINHIGCIDTVVKENYIFVDGPRGFFDFEPKSGCAPLTVTFTSTTENAVDFTWVFGDGGLAHGETATWTYETGGIYLPVLVISDSLNTSMGDTSLCTITLFPSDTVLVISSVPDFSFVDTLYCPGDAVQFTDETEGMGEVNSWLWEFGDGGTSTTQNPTYSFETPGEHTVTLSVMVDTCESSISKTIRVFEYPDVSIVNSEPEGCYPHEVNFYVDIGTVAYPAISYTWNFGDGSADRVQQYVDHQFLNSGEYDITLTILYANGCEYTYHFPTDIVVHPLPTADFDFYDDFVYPSEMVNFINTSSGEITDWYWDMGDGTVYDTINSFQHSFYTSGFYDVMLWVSTDAGCIDSTRKTVTITEGVVIPNVFTPNGDGVNDEFEIITYGMFEKMEIKIYNRWGNLVWQNTDPLLFWDGKEMRSGDECAEGVYYYTFQATSLTGSEYSKNGSVTLLR